ncbi:MAG: hypothetical protein ABJM06_06505 [Gilvibacter sp.]
MNKDKWYPLVGTLGLIGLMICCFIWFELDRTESLADANNTTLIVATTLSLVLFFFGIFSYTKKIKTR